MTHKGDNYRLGLDDDYQPSSFGSDDRDLLDDLADQATEADYEATAYLLERARRA